MSTTQVSTRSFDYPSTASMTWVGSMDFTSDHLNSSVRYAAPVSKLIQIACIAGTLVATAGSINRVTEEIPPTAKVWRIISDASASQASTETSNLGSVNPQWPTDVQLLARSIIPLFSNPVLKLDHYVDPDEGWVNHVLNVETGLSGEQRIVAEDGFYALADESPEIRVALKAVIVSFT